jgi:hypothetical protein
MGAALLAQVILDFLRPLLEVFVRFFHRSFLEDWSNITLQHVWYHVDNGSVKSGPKMISSPPPFWLNSGALSLSSGAMIPQTAASPQFLLE